ncbi:MAG: hypothetical protein IPJ82_13420 [Lewinellaceae bacterium]|nr:hypothetical protein [Lewinellaceae bacterium]
MKHFQKFVLFTLLIIAGSCNKEKTPTQSVDSSKEISEVSSNLFQTTGSFDFVTDAELNRQKNPPVQV